VVDKGIKVRFFCLFCWLVIWVFLGVCFSLKRDNNNAQGGQSRASVPTVNSSPMESSNVLTPRSAAVQNGSHVQPQFHGKIVFLKEKKRNKKLSFTVVVYCFVNFVGEC
jgi:hypothetical protein